MYSYSSASLSQADLDRLHATSLADVVGGVCTATFWAAETVGTVVLALALAYAVVHAARWVRDLHRAVLNGRSK